MTSNLHQQVYFPFSQKGSLYEHGAYFVEKASFADSYYSYKSPLGHKEIFMATVLTGESCWLSREDRILTMLPPKPASSKNDTTLSVHTTMESAIYLLYMSMTWPIQNISYPTISSSELLVLQSQGIFLSMTVYFLNFIQVQLYIHMHAASKHVSVGKIAKV